MSNIQAFVDLVSTRVKEITDDSDAFTEWLSMIGDVENVTVHWAGDPDILAIDCALFQFNTVFGELEYTFSVSFINEEIDKALSYDPYFIDVSYIVDVQITDLDKDDVLSKLDNMSGLYVDPIRPFSWLMSRDYFDETATIEDVTAIFLILLKDFFHMKLTHKPNLKLIVDNTYGG